MYFNNILYIASTPTRFNATKSSSHEYFKLLLPLSCNFNKFGKFSKAQV